MDRKQWDVSVGKRLRLRRERLGLSAAGLARQMRAKGHLALSPGHQLERESGKRRVQPWELPDYCRILRMPLWWLLGMSRAEASVLDANFVDESSPGPGEA